MRDRDDILTPEESDSVMTVSYALFDCEVDCWFAPHAAITKAPVTINTAERNIRMCKRYYSHWPALVQMFKNSLAR